MHDESTMTNDSTLKRDVENELKWEPCVSAAHIGVSAKDGIVTLSGHIFSYGEKRAAEKAAKRIYGAKAVVDEMHVQLPGYRERAEQRGDLLQPKVPSR